MATRNRTAVFLKYREAVRQSRPFSGDGHVTLDIPPQATHKGGYVQLQLAERGSPSSSLPPIWVDISERVKDEMQKIRAKMAELAKAQARALLPNFDDSRNPHEENIELLTQEITISLKRCEKNLQRLTEEGGAPSENRIICKNVQRSMATDLQALSMEFRKQSKGYLRRLEKQQEGSGRRRKLSISEPEDDELYDPGFSESQMMRVKRMENVSAEREQEVNEIVSSVNELAQMMKDLSVLVIDQGTVVDRIDYNIQHVSANVEKGVKQLVKAENAQKRTALVCCVMLLVVMCLFMLVVLLLKKLVF